MNLSPDQIARELATRKLANFARLLWPVLEPHRPLVWGWHMDLICDNLERSYRGGLAEPLVINIPPRGSKSSLVSVLGPAWWWLHRPQAQYICLTAADINARRDARHMRRIVRSEQYQELVSLLAKTGRTGAWSLPGEGDRDHPDTVRYYATSAGGHRISQTTGSDITGAGADYLVIDDPHDAEEVTRATPDQTRRILDTTWTRYQEVWTTRLNPAPSPAAVQVIMQRLHKEDLAGRLLARDAEALVLPIEYETDHPYRCSEDPRTTDGEVLDPVRFDSEFIARLRSDPRRWAGQYQQRPTAREGGQIKRSWFRERYTGDPRGIARGADELWVTCDAAKKGGLKSDYHSIQVWARLGAKRYLLARRKGRWAYPEFEAVLDALIAEWRPLGLTGVLIEDTANGTTYIQRRQHKVPGLIGFSPTRDTPGRDKSKQARAIYLESSAEAAQVILPDPSMAPWAEDWLQTVCDFPNGENDDDMDAASQLLMRWALREDQDWGCTLSATVTAGDGMPGNAHDAGIWG